MDTINNRVEPPLPNGVWSNAEHYRYKKLLKECKDIGVFEHEGRLFKGYKAFAVVQFIKSNPEPEDFNVWLQDNYEGIIITPLT